MGYFRLFYYIAYTFNFITRMFKRHGKLMLLLACIIIMLVICMYTPKSHALYIGDYDYGDPNYAMYSQYESIFVDLIKRWENLPDSTTKETLYNLLINNQNSMYIWYGGNGTSQLDGSPMLNGVTYNRGSLYILVYSTDVGYFTVGNSSLSNYCGVSDIDIHTYTFTKYTKSGVSYNRIFRLYGNASISEISLNDTFNVLIPSQLFMYQSKYFVDYFYNNYTAQEIELLYEMNEGLNNIQDTLTDDTVSSDTNDTTDEIIEDSIGIFDNSYTNSYNTYNNSFLNSILTPIQQMVDGTTTKSVTFTLPFVNYSFTIRSNAIYSHISTTALYTLIQLFWWVTFSIPIYKLLRRIIIWLGTGEFINKPSKFAMYMSDFISQNITPGMM